MVEDCFSDESLDDDGRRKEDKSVQIVRPWFKQPLPQLQPRRAEHVPPTAVLRQLVAGKDDLPACLSFYPIGDQPHSIHGTWLASKSENFTIKHYMILYFMYGSFFFFLEANVMLVHVFSIPAALAGFVACTCDDLCRM